MNKAKIIMYHYVRPIQKSNFPEIKGLEVEQFKNQIKFFENKFEFPNTEILFESLEKDQKNGKTMPIFLTFDDGLKDHYEYVFPILKEKKIQGMFFPPAKPIEEKIVLDVHKIHFILASVNEKITLVNDIFNQIQNLKKEYKLEESEKYWERLATPNRFDDKEVIFIKRILQRELPKIVREEITNRLFEKYVTKNEVEFSQKLYLSFEEIAEMKEEGMYFSSHSYSHEWLAYLDSEELDKELEKSWKFCEKINPKGKQIMCYPYGNYDSEVIKKISKYNFKAALTTDVGDATIDRENAFRLKRFDTNDFPQ